MHWNDIFATRNTRMKASEIRELLKLLDQPDILSFAGGIPDPNLFPAQEFQQAFAACLTPANQATALQYSVSEGYVPLRQWIAGEMAKLGVPCDIDNILITSGSQQALDYLGKLMLSPKDTALVNWPTYLGALGAFNAYEPQYDRLDDRLDDGLDDGLNDGIDQPNEPLVRHASRSAQDYRQTAKNKGGQVKFAYTSVDFANPTGKTLDLAARQSLLDLAQDMQIAIIEDAAYQSLRYQGTATPPILALDIAQNGGINQTRTIYCGSFSKTLSPGLRMGWVCAAAPVISQLVLIKQASDLHSPTLNQMAVHHVASRCFDAHVAQIRTAYGHRCDMMLAALASHMPKGVTWTRPEGGMFIWLTLPQTINATDLLASALKHEKLAFVPGQAFFADGSGQNTLRLAFSCADGPMINDGMARLGRVLRQRMA